MIVKIPADLAYLQWIGEQIGWGAFMLFHRPLLRATRGYQSAELVSVLPVSKTVVWLVFRVEIPPPLVR